MYIIIRDILVELMNIPAGEFTNWLIMFCAVLLLFILLFK